MRSFDGGSRAGNGDALSEKIMMELEEDIVFGRLKPGQKLPEEELSERFAASRHQVREALARLQHVGIVIKERSKGVTVLQLQRQEVHQIYEVRECCSARPLIISLPVPRARSSRCGLSMPITRRRRAWRLSRHP
jgi:DNA-binding GntR family transcriptional regulator